ncbi:hypothetical protein DL89DRAFT_105630 [Linderina pennispora]|uniref:Uncharacterized protein n=1 Tax=Linderina pennispora TaxID=61395 RepID=A0A1Y1WEQ8_9FUNG|nr:uncharacterized protein DL89DRAFT_105630 [Linderina pennispora]ORX72009.1 hypothetical protein DL89DRAFT_105630 [Linderina pennispora]
MLAGFAGLARAGGVVYCQASGICSLVCFTSLPVCSGAWLWLESRDMRLGSLRSSVAWLSSRLRWDRSGSSCEAATAVVAPVCNSCALDWTGGASTSIRYAPTSILEKSRSPSD